ncbi:MAG: bifunctional oligoribonuclease/PAP phosphatase NrnA [Bacteroidetes bacterium]|nr:MAG: bifunctional oligoribonuclease/PAP phosphatase NrnA [Bacteroidota bacterium]
MEIDIKEKAVKLKNIIESSNNIVIFGHVNPDGDAIGSSLGLFHYLKNKGKNPTVIMPNDFPAFLKWIPAANQILNFEKQTDEAAQLIENADLIFYCDFNDLKRVSKLSEKEKDTKAFKVMIDHHPQPTGFANIEISDTSVSSTSELVYEAIQEMGDIKYLNSDFADSILTGIITDTGLFHHNSEKPRTFEVVAELIKLGGNKEKVIDQVYNTFTYDRLKLLGNSLYNGMHVLPEYSSAYIVLTKENQEKFNYQNGDSEGHVNWPLSINNINFSALFTEKDDLVKVSFRSKDHFDVNLFAREHYHGGGHKKAAGGKSYKPLNETLEEFVSLLKKYQEEIKSQ